VLQHIQDFLNVLLYLQLQTASLVRKQAEFSDYPKKNKICIKYQGGLLARVNVKNVFTALPSVPKSLEVKMNTFTDDS
jgi:hypothetical protein